MPEHFRALVLILVFASIAFALAKRPLTAFAVAEEDFKRRRNLWFAVTVIAFMSHSFWIMLAVVGALLLYVGRREHNPMALFAILMFAVPPFSAKLSGLGLVNQLLLIDYSRMLALCILLPAVFRIRRERTGEEGRFLWPDIFVVGFIATQLGLRFTVDSATNTMRYAIYAGLDVWLPYYVGSRTLRDVRAFREVIVSFVMAAMVMALIAAFEAARYWLPYTSLVSPLGVQWSLGGYLSRGAFLRAQVTTGQPIVLGYIMVVAIAAYLYVKRTVSLQSMWWLGFVALAGGLIASFSRGPWMAALAAILLFRFTTPKAVGGLLKLSAGAGIIAVIVLNSPIGESVIEYLPFVGNIETENVAYREHLLQVSIQLIMQHPWFGSFDYIYALAEQDLVIGGMVDIVNTYIGVGLANGLVGLGSFVGAFAVTMFAIWKSMLAMENKEDERHTLGSGLLAAIGGALITIFTVSSISFIPLVYWTLLGLGVGYVRMSRSAHVAADPTVQMPVGAGRYGSPAGARAT